MVYHILKDGTKVKDLTGVVIRQKDNSTLYDVIGKIEERVQRVNKTKK